MTDYDFGRMIHRYCYQAQAREAILASMQAGDPACDAAMGFASMVSSNPCRAESDWLKKFAERDIYTRVMKASPAPPR